MEFEWKLKIVQFSFLLDQIVVVMASIVAPGGMSTHPTVSVQLPDAERTVALASVEVLICASACQEDLVYSVQDQVRFLSTYFTGKIHSSHINMQLP